MIHSDILTEEEEDEEMKEIENIEIEYELSMRNRSKNNEYSLDYSLFGGEKYDSENDEIEDFDFLYPPKLKPSKEGRKKYIISFIFFRIKDIIYQREDEKIKFRNHK